MVRPARKYSQAARLHDIIRLIESRKGVTVAELAGETGVDRRTIYRDLGAIEDAGYPLSTERDGRETIYRFMRPMKEIPPIQFTLDELFSLHLLKASAEILEGTPFHRDLTTVFRKITSALPPRLVPHLERVAAVPLLIPQGKRQYPSDGEDLTRLRDALLHQKVVRLTYRPSGQGDTGCYTVNPYSIVLYRGGLYLIGFAAERNGIRTFALERIRGVEQTGERFDIPEGYRLQRRYSHSFGIVPEPPVRVRIRFSPAVAEHVAERIWHPSQTTETGEDGSVILTLKVGGKREIFSWILSHGADAEILSPLSWRRELAAIAERMGAIYGAWENSPGKRRIRQPSCIDPQFRYTRSTCFKETSMNLEGKPAPPFSLPGSDGKTHSLSDYAGKTVVLYFYPRDNTPGCTKEACAFRDIHGELAGRDVVLLGVSRDSLSSHERFIRDFGLPFVLLSDPDASVMRSYGAYGEKVMYGKKVEGVIRSTVIIGPDQTVLKHWQRVAKAETHPLEVRAWLNQKGEAG